MKTTMKFARLSAHFTQKQVADALGITSSRYASWENGKTDIPHRFVNPFCDFVGVDVDDLIFLPISTEIQY